MPDGNLPPWCGAVGNDVAQQTREPTLPRPERPTSGTPTPAKLAEYALYRAYTEFERTITTAFDVWMRLASYPDRLFRLQSIVSEAQDYITLVCITEDHRPAALVVHHSQLDVLFEARPTGK